MATKQIEPTMMVFSADWRGKRTFRLLPISKDCPFNEALYDPEAKLLAVISKDKITKPTMIPKLDNKGMIVTKKVKVEGGDQIIRVEERKDIENYYEYYIDRKEDIEDFIKSISINPTHNELKNLLYTPIVGKPEATKKSKKKASKKVDMKPSVKK